MIDSVENYNIDIYKQLRTYYYQLFDTDRTSKISTNNIYNSLVSFFEANKNGFSKGPRDKITDKINGVSSKYMSPTDADKQIRSAHDLGYKLTNKVQKLSKVLFTINAENIMRN